MEKKKLISLLNLSCNNFDNLTSILNQKNIIIGNDCLDTTTEETFTIKCYNNNGKLTKFKI